jgi:hypothetical protein
MIFGRPGSCEAAIWRRAFQAVSRNRISLRNLSDQFRSYQLFPWLPPSTCHAGPETALMESILSNSFSVVQADWLTDFLSRQVGSVSL